MTQRADQTDKEALIAMMAERGGWIVNTDVWRRAEPGEPEYPYMRCERTKTVQEVRNELLVHLGAPVNDWDYVSDDVICKAPEDGGYGMEGLSNFAHLVAGYPDEPVVWPAGRISVYAVRGSSEGDYVHVDVVDHDTGVHQLVLLAKTFSGRDAAWRFARVLADLLGA